MELQLDLAVKYAKTHFGKRIRKKDLAEAMWPDAKHPYLAYYALMRQKDKKVSMSQIEAIMRLTGIPLNMLIQ